MSVRDRALDALRSGFALPPRLTPSAWAEANVILPEGSAMPGRFRFAQTPYMREPFDHLGPDSPIKKVVIVGGAQIAKTQLLLNALAFWIATDPKPVMAVWPTVDVARRLVRTRIDPLFKLIPDVKARLVPERSREAGNATFLKTLAGGAELIIVGANAPAPLRSSPINYIVLDEVSAYGPTLEGDVLDLVEERQNTYRLTAKTLAISTPLDEGTCLITRAYRETEQSRYFVPCLRCGHRFPITFADIQWPKGKPDQAVLVCPSCGGVHDDFDKVEQLAHGIWTATTETRDATARGYHIPGLLSPWLPYGKIASRHVRAGRDPVRLRVFVNATLAETWAEHDGDAPVPEDALLARREPLAEDTVPEGACLVTVGTDTQDDRLEAVVIAWGPEEESWTLGQYVFVGDPAGPAPWRELEDLLVTTWRHPTGARLPVRAACIDSGGHRTQAVYDFTRGKESRRVWPIKGFARPGAPIWPKKPTRNNKGTVPLYMVNTDAAKDAISARLRMAEAGPGYMHFADHPTLDRTFFEGLNGERPVTRYSKGRPVREWRPVTGRRNEPLDCTVYALAALHGLRALGVSLDRELASLRRNAATPRAKVQARPSSAIPSPWISG